MTDGSPVEYGAERMPTRSKVIAGLVGCAVLVAASYMMLRISSPAIRPDQVPPVGHYPGSCALCHTLTSETAVIEVAR